MKNYLLKPHKRIEISKGKYWVVKGGLKECWKFIKDKYFFCIHLIYDSKTLIKSIDEKDLNDEEKIKNFIY